MNRAKVWYVNARSQRSDESMMNKLDKLFDLADVGEMISKGAVVALKLHWGELGCTRFIRPIYVRKLVEKVREAGGLPFVTETTAHGIGLDRANGVEYLMTAMKHGFTSCFLQAPVIIADGIRGDGTVRVAISNGIQLKQVSIAKELANSDVVLAITHFKGNDGYGFGGTLKNIGMGAAGKEGKTLMHFYNKPQIDASSCDNCGKCVNICPKNAIKKIENRYVIDEELCYCCWACVALSHDHWICGEKTAIFANPIPVSKQMDRGIRMAEHVAGLLEAIGRDDLFCFNFVMDVTPSCDCTSWSDIPIVPDLGILASKDPVAVDQASLDLVNAAPGIPGSMIEKVGGLARETKKFELLHPQTLGGICQIEAAEKLGIGTREYTLIGI